MADSLAATPVGVALAAGAGTRLRPLTMSRPKPLCPVGNRALVDWAVEALAPVSAEIAVNVHHGREALEEHLRTLGPRGSAGRDIHVSVEEHRALGTAGAIGAMREWLGGRPALVVNADTWHRIDLRRLVDGWDGERVRVLTSTPLPFGPRSGVVASMLPWPVAARLEAEPAGLWEVVWSGELADGRIDALHSTEPAIDCGTPADYLRANMTWSGGRSVIGDGAVVEGTVDRCVVWSGSAVQRGERLVDAVRGDGRTVLVR
jgi:N-acetyl-alpha-D-muramate 1-phosphate uridylyltransferase